ncbi:MAG TPA: prolipoprotein diacylglyceryl transferase [Steroidobacteraceae bacterium]|nr:prolipoprotein diacylglyceryl transferase [Steroidobacteraceae bacterium]
MITYPHINPAIFSIGPVPLLGTISVRWYGMMYVCGFVAAWLLARKRAMQSNSTWNAQAVEDLIFFAAMGVILGGRIGWVLFYGFTEELQRPSLLFRIWEGGMSFHGGLIGVVLALVLFARRRGRSIMDVCDFTAPLPALGLMFGRIGNFINGELWGKPTDVPWAFVVDGVPKHPSQLYEASLEGLTLFLIIWFFTSKPKPQLAPSGLWLLCYGIFRFMVEFVRVPDANRGYLLWGWVTEGQILCVPMMAAGIYILVWSYRRNQPSGNYKTP